MTIIKPNKYRGLKNFIVALFLLVAIGGSVYVWGYNTLVDMRYQIKIINQQIVEAQAINVDLKQALYKAIDPSKLEDIALEIGLQKEKKVEYVRL